MRQSLIEAVQRILGNAGWATCLWHGCFDIAANKERLLLIKVLANIDALQPETARNLKIISANLAAAVLVVGERTSREKLAPGVVYEREQLPAVSLATLEKLFSERVFPEIWRDRGGLYVQIDRALLRAARQRAGMSQRELAEAVGISKKAIYEHERSQLRAMLAIASRLESVLAAQLRVDIDILARPTTAVKTAPKDRLEAAVGRDLGSLGFKTEYIGQAPFDIFAREQTLILSDIETRRRAILRRASSLSNFIAVVRRPAVIITEGIKPELEIPVIARHELKELTAASELIRIAQRVI